MGDDPFRLWMTFTLLSFSADDDISTFSLKEEEVHLWMCCATKKKYRFECVVPQKKRNRNTDVDVLCHRCLSK